jgi:NAD(P)-dependent dehydrogenase (short-subunit alcohol dehydrogenase family)
MRLKNKVVLVTGGVEGIGRAIAEMFAAEGAIVIAGETGVVPLDPRFSNVEIENVYLDVTNEADWQRVIADILKRHGRLDILVNNAAIVVNDPLDAPRLKAWQRVVAANQT